MNTTISVKELQERGILFPTGEVNSGKARFASLRGTHGDCAFRMDCAGSDKRYGSSMACAPSERLYIFESPIRLSHASLVNAATGDRDAWEQHNRLSLAGTSDAALLFFLNKRPSVKELVFCLDNDPAGREASAVMARKYAEQGLQTRIELPKGKDFNEDLTAILTEKSRLKRANFLHRDVTI